MDAVNAIAKVRFGSARPQRILLSHSDGLTSELLCLEAAQEFHVTGGEWVYYVVTGTAAVTSGQDRATLPAGQFAALSRDEKHTLANAGEGRLICLAVGREK
ncbi:MAG TPA: cupin domain-containing protein [Phycisphaerae bacterium]|nr:cupin domain-containing protein [Phycisphaerae bacterium]